MVISFSPRHMSYLVFKRRKVFLGTLATALALYSGLVLTQKSQYESTSSIVVKIVDQDAAMPQRFSEQTGALASSFSTLAKEVINSVQVVITSPDVLDKAINKIGIDTVYPRLTQKAQKARLPVNTLAVEKLLQDIKVRVNSETNVLTLSLFNTSPVVARATLQALISATISKHAMVMRDPRLQFLERKLATLKNEADSAEQAALQFKQKSGISVVRRGALAALEAARHYAGQPQRDPGRAVRRLRPRQVARRLLVEDAEGHRDLRRKRSHAAPDRRRARTARHPRKLGSKLRSSALPRATPSWSTRRRSTSRRNTTSSRSVRSRTRACARVRTRCHKHSVRASRPRVPTRPHRRRRCRSAISSWRQIDERLAYLNNNEITMRELERRRDLAEREYRSYLERAQSARIVSDMNDAGLTSLSVLQAPTLPYQPARPRKLCCSLLALFAGWSAAWRCACSWNRWTTRSRYPSRSRRRSGCPLLAVVNLHRPDGAR